MTTSDKITHVMDVLFFVALLVLIFFFARADREHDRHLASLEGTIQKLQGQVGMLESKLISPRADGASATPAVAPASGASPAPSPAAAPAPGQ